MLAEVGIKCYSIPMINRKDQIHATLYNAAIDGGFMLSVEDLSLIHI